MPLLTAEWLPSASAQSRIHFQASGLATPMGYFLGWGIAASTPATWAALTGSDLGGVVYIPDIQVQRAPGIGTIIGTVQAGPIGAAGNLAWVVLLPFYPAGGTVPVGVVGPFAVAA
jgi:hypothetical protein